MNQIEVSKNSEPVQENDAQGLKLWACTMRWRSKSQKFKTVTTLPHNFMQMHSISSFDGLRWEHVSSMATLSFTKDSLSAQWYSLDSFSFFTLWLFHRVLLNKTPGVTPRTYNEGGVRGWWRALKMGLLSPTPIRTLHDNSCTSANHRHYAPSQLHADAQHLLFWRVALRTRQFDGYPKFHQG